MPHSLGLLATTITRVFAGMFLATIAMFVVGCASSGAAGPSSNRSYVREGENVFVRLVTWEEWNDPKIYARPTYSVEKNVSVKVELPPELKVLGVAEADEALRFGGVGEVAAALVGAAIDFVKVQLEKEAAKHTQQYKQFTYADDFWKGPGLAKYAAFELIRYADGFNTPEKPAFRMVCAIVPSRYDRRIVLLRPVYLKVNAAAAKVSPGWSGDRRFTIEAKTVVQGAGVDDKGGFEQKDLADATLSIPGYNLDESPALYATFKKNEGNSTGDGVWEGPLKDSVAGYFRAPLPPVTKETQKALADAVQNLREAEANLASEIAENGKDSNQVKAATKAVAKMKDNVEKLGNSDSAWYTTHRGGAFRLSVVVTETDDSRARTTLLEFAEFVGQQREGAVKLTKKQFDSP
jgi:hypothetical protein